jgi:regulator of PEP synthase PpsR (kinase-PPPase family)
MRHHEIDKADIVILGVSRTFKTPLSIYLATKGWFVANIPIILNIDPPASVYKINPENVFCLMTNPKHLSQLRKSRHEHLGGITGNYAEYMHVADELKFAQQLYRHQPKWTIVNVTGKSIEEIASEILALKRKSERVLD